MQVENQFINLVNLNWIGKERLDSIIISENGTKEEGQIDLIAFQWNK